MDIPVFLLVIIFVLGTLIILFHTRISEYLFQFSIYNKSWTLDYLKFQTLLLGILSVCMPIFYTAINYYFESKIQEINQGTKTENSSLEIYP